MDIFKLIKWLPHIIQIRTLFDYLFAYLLHWLSFWKHFSIHSGDFYSTFSQSEIKQDVCATPCISTKLPVGDINAATMWSLTGFPPVDLSLQRWMAIQLKGGNEENMKKWLPHFAVYVSIECMRWFFHLLVCTSCCLFSFVVPVINCMSISVLILNFFFLGTVETFQPFIFLI